jgi:hypothetical protein
MKYIEYLYFKYYSFQEKMGNKDVAPFSSMLIIAFTFMLYYFSIVFLSLLFIPIGILNLQPLTYVSVIFFFVLNIWLYLLLVNSGKYKDILKRNEEYRGRKRLGAVLFPLVAFILFNIGWILKLLQNQGKL